jgi:hypothetical protein
MKEHREQRGIPFKEQLKLPRRLRAEVGDVFEVILRGGIARITFAEDLVVNVEVERFKPDKAAKERALRAFEGVLSPYVLARLTEVGSQYVAPDEIGFPAQTAWKQKEEAIKKIMKSLLNQGIKPEEVEEEMQGLILNKGGVPEVHMGIPHPSLRNILTDLRAILNQVVSEREQIKQKLRTR